MSGNVAVNPQTGEILVLSPAGQWAPAQRARNPETGQELFYDGQGWRDVPAPPQPPRQRDGLERAIGVSVPEAGRRIGMGVRDVAQGLLAVPGMVYDAAGALVNTATGALEAAGGPSLPRVRTAAENVDTVADAAGLARPGTSGERMVSAASRNVAATLPTIGAGAALQGAGQAPALAQTLAGGIPAQIGGAVGAGLAGEAAAQADAPAVAQIGAALAGGVAGAGAVQGVQAGGRLAAGIVQPFTEQGRRQMTADILLRSSADPEGLPGRLASGLDDPTRRLPGAPVTTGTATRDPGLMLLESGLRSQAAPNTPTGRAPAIAIRDAEAQRNAARVAAINALRDNSTPETRGNAVRTALNMSDDAMGERVDLAFRVARDRNTSRYSAQPVLEEAGRVTRMFDPAQGGGGVPSELQSVIDDIGNIGNLTLTQAQNIRSRLGDIAGRASAAGDNRLASAAAAVSARLEETIDDPRWMSAVALRREQGAAVGRNAEGVNTAGQILRTDRFGAPQMPDANVAQAAVRSPQATRQVLEAYYKALDDARAARLPAEQIAELSDRVKAARGALRGQFMENLFNASATASDVADAAGNVTRALSPAQFRRFFDQNAEVARELFEPGQLLQLQRLAADFAETGMASRTVNAAGSNTAQNLSVANLIARTSNGLIDPGMPLAQTMAGLGGVMRLIYAAPEAAVREMLTRAMVDPQFAQLLLSRASPQSVTRAAAYIEQNMVERLAQAATDAAGRASLRTGTAEATRPTQP